jgi:hypothetical protein
MIISPLMARYKMLGYLGQLARDVCLFSCIYFIAVLLFGYELFLACAFAQDFDDARG